MRKIRILLADDHEIVRSGVRLRLETQMDMTVVAEAADCATTVRNAAASKPDVLLLDVEMPGGSGLDIIAQLRRVSPATRVIVLTGHSDARRIKSAIHAGAAGFIDKTCSTAELLAAIRAVDRGQSYVSAHGGALQDALGQGTSPLPNGAPGTQALSEREGQVLELMAYGYTYKEIASELGISVKTVETYRARLSDKLGLRTRTDIIRYALDHDILRA